MAGIEDFVVEQILQDFAQSPQAPIIPTAMPAPGSSFLREAQEAGQFKQTGLPPGAVSEPSAPRGFTIADPALRERYSQAEGRQAAAAATGGGIERAMRERDQQRFKILEGIRGLDPQIQSTILRRLGIDAGPIKSQIEQQKELLKYKEELEAPQREVANAIKMMLATQGGQQNLAELQLKQRAQEQEAASRGQTQNIQLMRVLATLMQADASGQLTKTLGPLLMQMLQGSGINLAPQQQGASAGGRAGIKITRE